jgi:hypothetical protein
MGAETIPWAAGAEIGPRKRAAAKQRRMVGMGCMFSLLVYGIIVAPEHVQVTALLFGRLTLFKDIV